MSPIYDVATMWELLDRRAEATPDAPFLLDPEGRAARRSPRPGRGRHGSPPGCRASASSHGTPVSWQLPTRIETVVTSLALARLGAVQNPIIHIYRDREVGFALRQTGARLFLVPGEWRGFDYAAMAERIARVPQPGSRRLRPAPRGRPRRAPAAPARRRRDPLDLLHVRYDLGPQGRAAHRPDAARRRARAWPSRWACHRPTSGSVAFPFAHIGGPDYLVTCLASGFPVAALRGVRAGRYVRSCTAARRDDGRRQHRVLHRVPGRAAQRSRAARPIPSLRLLSGGGAPKPPEVYFEVKRELGIPVAHGYGMTEVPMICQGSPLDTDDQLAHTEGAPVFGAEVRVVVGGRVGGGARCGGRGPRPWADGVQGLHRPGARRGRLRRPKASSVPATSAMPGPTGTSPSPVD